MGDLTKNFNRNEFACKCGCDLDAIDPDLVDNLQHSRDAVGLPFVIHSGIRCPAHNKSEGGEDNSAHLKGLAVDILCPNSAARYAMLFDFIRRFRRVGIGATFIHVDIDPNLPSGVVWLY